MPDFCESEGDSRCFIPGQSGFLVVPRVTLAFRALASTREMLFLVSGASKREILTRVMAGAGLPAARAYAEGDLVWLVDRAAAPECGDVGG